MRPNQKRDGDGGKDEEQRVSKGSGEDRKRKGEPLNLRSPTYLPRRRPVCFNTGRGRCSRVEARRG